MIAELSALSKAVGRIEQKVDSVAAGQEKLETLISAHAADNGAHGQATRAAGWRHLRDAVTLALSMAGFALYAWSMFSGERALRAPHVEAAEAR